MWVHPESKAALYVGNQFAAREKCVLESRGIFHIMNCQEAHAPNFHESDERCGCASRGGCSFGLLSAPCSSSAQNKIPPPRTHAHTNAPRWQQHSACPLGRIVLRLRIIPSRVRIMVASELILLLGVQIEGVNKSTENPDKGTGNHRGRMRILYRPLPAADCVSLVRDAMASVRRMLRPSCCMLHYE